MAQQQAAAHENAQQPPADLRLHPDDAVGIGFGAGMEDDPTRGDAGGANTRGPLREFKAAFCAAYIRGSPFRLTQIVAGGGPLSCMWCSRPSK